jgi:hypothetical protein
MPFGKIRNRACDAEKGIRGIGFFAYGQQKRNVRAYLVRGGDPCIDNLERLCVPKTLSGFFA